MKDLDLSEYPNLTKIDLGHNSRLTSLKLAHSNRITCISLFDTGIDNFSFMADTPYIQTIWFPQTGDIIDYNSGKVYIAKALRESCQENYKVRTIVRYCPAGNSIFTKPNPAETIDDQQSQINELSNISFPNNPYFIKLKRTLETQKQIVKSNETPQRYILNGKMEAYQTILSSSLADVELQHILNKQTEVLDLKEYLENLKLI
ncbi:18852_t:CDS:2 [Funneliformis geosporum]|uniref:14378_t:CDS:1 n=1 Tax=Funneliformis geosporum TaxID=1117311 RepID=A0A9W4WIU9_9GLOM|nr:14378_t:CDS:2 [Funneliformis geosporum]CAI2168660.1 18852_t:CDS:2 [Funneliformis geosporum]